MVSEQQASDFAREWLEAWNAHDLERILSHYHPEVVFTSPFITRLAGREDGTLQGLAALREYFAQALAAFPDLRFEPISVLNGLDSVVLHYRSVQGLLTAEYMELDTDGQVVRVRAHYAKASP
jgi:ketosteroid isomerase-like protein